MNCLLKDTRISIGIENNVPRTTIAKAALASRVRHGSSLRTGVEVLPRRRLLIARVVGAAGDDLGDDWEALGIGGV